MCPQLIVPALIRRIESYLQRAGHMTPPWVLYRSLKGVFHTFATTEKHRENLCEIRDYALEKEENARHLLAQLFAEVSLDYDIQSIEVLADWVTTGDEQQLRTVASLLRDATSEVKLDQLDLIAVLLQRVESSGFACSKAITGDLQHAAVPSSWSVVEGQPTLPEFLHSRYQEAIQRFPAGSLTRQFLDEIVASLRRIIKFAR